MLEKEIEKILVQEVKKLGGRAYKWVSPGNNGVPDRIIIFPGQMPIFAELKTDSGKVSSVQRVQLKRLSDLGQRVHVIYGISGVCQFFRDHGFEEASRKLVQRYGL